MIFNKIIQIPTCLVLLSREQLLLKRCVLNTSCFDSPNFTSRWINFDILQHKNKENFNLRALISMLELPH